ncbi:MAG TPA: tryptophan 2,3-dioxygenase family protein [Polyangiaceae bacterium]|nr:tryptophan 2,3-dioxygenase family protein [Polyangiaceae bacterium]HMR77905.1 tryptophan 2,3-dioxygenase family protein [Polyangiaceae bacterium]
MKTPNYWDYLKLDQLLSLQGGIEGDDAKLIPDELHFVVVHQVLELWFKLTLRELREARDHLASPEVPEEQIPYVVHHMRRASTILELAVEHFKVMETLTPQDFLAFRDKLIPASGFQSFQLRELEIVLGFDESRRVTYGGKDPMEHIRHLAAHSPAGKLAWTRIEAARKELTLKAALHNWLFRTPIMGSSPGDDGDDAAIDRFVADYLQRLKAANAGKADRLAKALNEAPEPFVARIAEGEAVAEQFLMATDAPEEGRAKLKRIRAGALFIESYRELPLLAWPRLLTDTAVELEEQLVLFRTRHARMVERIIGRRLGTGGSSGVDYLDATTRYRIFDELWAVRTILLPKQELPPLQNGKRYGFAE